MQSLPDAVIFDMDGLLVDTESFSFRAFEHAVAAHELDELTELFTSLVGTNEQHHRETLQSRLADKVDPVEFRKTWIEHYKQLTTDETVPLLPGVLETLQWLQIHNVKTAVATSSATSAAEKKLSDAGISEYFMSVVCGDQVRNSKPHPDIYLQAGKSINASMSHSIGLEDSVNGAKSAHSAGLNVIQVPNIVPAAKELHDLGITVCNSMNEVLSLLKSGTAMRASKN